MACPSPDPPRCWRPTASSVSPRPTPMPLTHTPTQTPGRSPTGAPSALPLPPPPLRVAHMTELTDPSSEEPEAGRTLTRVERNVLEAAQITAPMRPGPRERYIREQLDMSPTRYFQLLNALLDKPAAWEAEPVLMRLLDTRRQRNRTRYW
ncbi:DUF3263 domain-containing protein [Streptomyces cinereoruber]